ncbi:MAG: recombinase family protein [Candidatus Methanomethylicia archaeon]
MSISVGYVRVSRVELDEENQINAINSFAFARGLKLVKIYVDKGVSGSKNFRNRPAANELLEELATIKPEFLLVFAIDRIGRDMRDTLNTILELEEKGIKVLSVREEWLQTLDQNIRKLILSILSWVAEFEKRRLRERQIAAWEAGKQKGRPEKQLPYREIVRRLEQGWTKKAIWRWLVTDRGLKISYDHYLRKLKKYMMENKIAIRRVIVKE